MADVPVWDGTDDDRVEVYIDESIDATTGTLVLAGYIASKRSWEAFSAEWAELLRPFGTLSKDGSYHFKMADMAQNRERMARLPVFLKTIERHVLGWLSISLNAMDLKRACARVQVPTRALGSIDWGGYSNPQFIAMRCLLDSFHLHRNRFAHAIPLKRPVDFIFDQRPEAKAIMAMWDSYLAARPPEIRELYGLQPRFVDDSKHLPLQAADLLAWWARKWVDEGSPERVQRFEIGGFKPSGRKYLRIFMHWTEDNLAKDLMKSVRSQAGQLVHIYDVRLDSSIRRWR